MESRKSLLFLLLLFAPEPLPARSEAAPDGQHSLSYQFSGLYEGLTLQEFSTVGLLDKAPIELDNQGHPARVPTRSPTQEYLGAEFGAEESWTQSPKKTWDQVLGEVLKQQSNQTHGRQTLQWRYGCEVVPGGLVLSWFQFALDGADAILFDVGNGRWLAAQPWAQAPCRWWEALPAFGRSLQRYLGDACPERMESFLRRRQERARRAAAPRLLLSSRWVSRPPDALAVSCQAWGFPSQDIGLRWIHKNQTLPGEQESPLPSGDGTYQSRNRLLILEGAAPGLRCQARHGDLAAPLEAEWESTTLRRPDASHSVLAGALLGICLCLSGLVGGWLLWKRRACRRHTDDNERLVAGADPI